MTDEKRKPIYPHRRHRKFCPDSMAMVKEEDSVFRNWVKVTDEEAFDHFYGYEINPFYCVIHHPITTRKRKVPVRAGVTHFFLTSVDDWGIRATIRYAMERSEATKICREFVRTIPRSGVTSVHFREFFESKGCEVDLTN